MALQRRRRNGSLVILALALRQLWARQLGTLASVLCPWRRLPGFPGPTSRVARRQAAYDESAAGAVLGAAEMRRVQRAVETKALEALAVGNLPPGRELELISALDLGTVPWGQLPIRFKERLGLPLQDRGIDSLALNLSVAVQAKDYEASVPLRSLATFHLLVRAEGSPLRDKVEHMVVATNESTQLPQEWEWTGAKHRKYTAEEIELWRARARKRAAAEEHRPEVCKLERWPHQARCLEACRGFLANRSTAKRDFFVRMATGTGKSLVMADLLAGLGAQSQACIIVPKLDLMEQMARLLEGTLPDRKVSRVGTGWPADLTAEVFVCVRNSAWQLEHLNFDVVLLDEAHHYEPPLPLCQLPKRDEHFAEDNLTEGDLLGVHAKQVLALNASKRVFFSATLIQNEPDFDFDLRPAIEAGVIMDYTVLVPVLSEGDPRPALVEAIHNLPLARKILAFCNTVHEAKSFTDMLNDAGIAANHYNGQTSAKQRQDILSSFAQSEARGGIRVLVTVDVLSEGVDLPVADTCLFVAPRQGVRLRQCVGRVLRRHPGKVDAQVIAPPIVQKNDSSLEEEAGLRRLLRELAMADPLFQASLTASIGQKGRRVGILAGAMKENGLKESLATKPARVLGMRVFPNVLAACNASLAWIAPLRRLEAYKAVHGHLAVPFSYRTRDGFKLGQWVSTKRKARSNGKLSAEQIESLDTLGFVWDPLGELWQQGVTQLQAYRAEHGDVLVPKSYATEDGFNLGQWVSHKRHARSQGKLSAEQIESLDDLGFVWDPWGERWQQRLTQLQAYRAEHGDVLVPLSYAAADGFKLGWWTTQKRYARSKGKLSAEQIESLDALGFVWDPLGDLWQQGVTQLQAYRAEHGDVPVPQSHAAADGFKLGQWVSTKRHARSQGKLSAEQIESLDALGFVWDPLGELWQQGVTQLQAYRAEHGDVLVPKSYATEDGFNLGQWVSHKRHARSQGKLSAEQIESLDDLGFVWDPWGERWQQRLTQLQAYRAEHGDVLVPFSYAAADLDALGFVWDPLGKLWQQGVTQLQAYRAEHGDVLVPFSHAAADGFNLGQWVKTQRKARSNGKLSAEQIESLDTLGFVWDPLGELWQQGVT
ncbi:unnamed protein product [Effrenium voratum]|nr:unnamed protein product [Effrenium voratum]